MARRYHRDQHIYAEYKNYESDGTTLVNCDAGYPKFTLTDPVEAVKVNATAMDYVSTGIYKYDDYAIASDGYLGWWDEKVEAVTSTKTTIKYDGFECI